jgi:hypothetical protein
MWFAVSMLTADEIRVRILNNLVPSKIGIFDSDNEILLDINREGLIKELEYYLLPMLLYASHG